MGRTTEREFDVLVERNLEAYCVAAAPPDASGVTTRGGRCAGCSPLTLAFRARFDKLSMRGTPCAGCIPPLMLSAAQHERALFQRAGISSARR